VKQYNNILPPGVIRCNETNKCHGFEFNNVDATGWWRKLGLGYITENIYGTVSHSRPAPDFSGGANCEEFLSSHITRILSRLIEDFTVSLNLIVNHANNVLADDSKLNTLPIVA